jgi:arylsulfatase A-like enzyme
MDQTSQTRSYLRARIGVAAGVLALLCGLALGSGQAHGAAAGEERPSFVVIQTDDETLDGLYASFSAYLGAPETRAMPNTIDLLAKRGMTFNRYYVSYPLCCPSRVTLLTGRYAHNHNVRGNVPPEGGYTGFTVRNAFSHNIATWLQGAGYRTIHIGKFLNGYGDEPFDNGTTVPPGWSAWHTVLKADTNHYYYGYTLNNNGVISPPYGDSGSWETREYGARDDPGCPFAPLNGLPCLYETDVFNTMATQEIEGTPPTRPFYLQLDYTAPHGDFRRPAGPEPPPRYYDWFWGAKVPHDASEGLNEGNANDKPSFIRDAPFLTGSELRTYRVYWEKQLEALRAVDDGVKEIVQTLGKLGRLRNTYIIFTSDNGFFFGEHRLAGGKFLAYEPATHLPLIIRGPGIAPSSTTGELAANIDIAPTVLELAGVKADMSIDGRSLVPYLADPELRSRRGILFESFVQTSDVEENGGGPAATPTTSASGASGGGAKVNSRGPANASIVAPPRDYEGIRLGPYKFIAWPTGEKELYDITRDPNELNNLAKVPNFFPVRNFLDREMRRLEDCSGKDCQQVAPEIPLTRKEQQRLRAKRQKEQQEREREKEKEKSHKGG